MAHIYLHLGLMKTGTTAMQDWFASQKPLLRSRGLHYLITGKGTRSASGNLADALMQNSPDLPDRLERVRREIAAEGMPAVLISAEAFSQYGPPSLQPLMAALAGHQVTFLISLRRQDRYAEALYKQTIKFAGQVSSIASFFTPELVQRLNYQTLLTAWQSHYPAAALHPMIYDEPDSDAPADSIASMLTALGLSDLIPADSVARRSNLTPHADMIALYNSVPAEQARALRRSNRQIMKEFGAAAMGKDDLIPPAFAADLMQELAASNEAVRQRWFPERPSLFLPSHSPQTQASRLDPQIIARFHALFDEQQGG